MSGQGRDGVGRRSLLVSAGDAELLRRPRSKITEGSLGLPESTFIPVYQSNKPYLVYFRDASWAEDARGLLRD
jgi:hypothetical protein